jgi:hypothetical protein
MENDPIATNNNRHSEQESNHTSASIDTDTQKNETQLSGWLEIETAGKVR